MAVTAISLSVMACGATDDDGSSGDSAGHAGSIASQQGGSGGSAGTVGSAPAVGEFCKLWIEEFSSYMERCACDSAAVRRYREATATACEPDGFLGLLGALPAAVAAGDFTYDGQAALALFARLHEPQPACVEEPLVDLKLDSVEVYSLAGVFLGTRALGQPCAHPVEYKGGISDCREGVCAWDGADAGVCVALVGRGEECDSSGSKNFRSTVPRLCHVRRPPDDDGEYASAFDSLICDVSPDQPGSRHCVDDRPDGSVCRSNEVCRSGVCLRGEMPNDDGVCTAKVADGQPCRNHLECISGACQNAEPRVCGPRFADGEACEYADSACLSGSCTSQGLSVCIPPATRALGASCTLGAECISVGHGESLAAACQSGSCVADICAAFAE